MTSLGSYLPAGGRAVWRRDREPEYVKEAQAVRHVVIRATNVVANPTPHVVYRIDVLTEHSHWYIGRRYNDFHDLHQKLVKKHHISRDLLPPKKFSGNFSQEFISTRREQLEQYLQKLINSEHQVSHSKELQLFLDVPSNDVFRVTKLLARQLYGIGDQLLAEKKAIALTVNDLHCITKRLHLPMEQQSSEWAADLGHLYSFLHQIKSLKVILPPMPSSVTRMAFEVTPFRSLEVLKVDSVPLSQVSGMVRLQQQLKKLSVQYSLKTLRELLIDSVEERRAQGADTSTQLVESWRLVATAKFTSNRVVVQPWHSLVSLNLSHNKLTHLDESLQVLPLLEELNLSHNLLMLVDLQHLCLPSLHTINFCHNNISTIEACQLILESVHTLNLSHNALANLHFLSAFIQVHTLNIAHNMVNTREDLSQLSQLKVLKTLSIKGNPVMGTHSARLVLLAKFMHKSHMEVVVDGMEATNREHARVQSLGHRYGPNPDDWPISKTISQTQSPTSLPLRAASPPTPQSPPPIHLSWRIESTSSTPELLSPRSGSPVDVYCIHSTSPAASTNTSTSSLCDEEVDHPLFANSVIILSTRPSAAESSKHMDCPVPGPRASPDGHSDSTSSPHSCEDTLATVTSPCSVSPPPCTPQLSTEECQVQITPQMISAALEALTQAASQATTLIGSPPEEQQLPDLLSQALHSWISEASTPPPTPNQEGSVGQNMSANDLIAALSSALSKHCAEGGNLSTGNSRAPSVPASTPQEGFGELARLGIQPEDVLHALSQLQLREVSPASPLDGEEESEKRTAFNREEGEEWISLDGVEQTALDREEDKEIETVPGREKREQSERQDSDQNEKDMKIESEEWHCNCDDENCLLLTDDVKHDRVPESIIIKEDSMHLLASLGDSDEENKNFEQENL